MPLVPAISMCRKKRISFHVVKCSILVVNKNLELVRQKCISIIFQTLKSNLLNYYILLLDNRIN